VDTQTEKGKKGKLRASYVSKVRWEKKLAKPTEGERSVSDRDFLVEVEKKKAEPQAMKREANLNTNSCLRKGGEKSIVYFGVELAGRKETNEKPKKRR